MLLLLVKLIVDFLHRVSDRSIIRHLAEPTTTGLAILSGEGFHGHVVGNGAVFTQALYGRHALARHEIAWLCQRL
jgi:hypothetical protein